MGGVGGFFDGVGHRFGDAFVEHGRNDVFGMEFIFGVRWPGTALAREWVEATRD